MMYLDDEILSAFLDNELSADKQHMIEIALANNADARERLAQLRRNDALLRSVFGALDEKPLPTELVAHILASDAHTKANNIISLKSFRFQGIRSPGFWPTSIAAALVLFFGVSLGVQTLNKSPEKQVARMFAKAKITPSNPLFDVLEKVPSARDITLGADKNFTAKAIMTVRLADGSLCRDLVVGNRFAAQHALACRNKADWKIRVLGPIEKTHQNGGFKTASGVDTNFDRQLDDLGAQTPLNAATEAGLIARGWE